MVPHEIFRAYADERKRFAPAGYRLESLYGLTRLTPMADGLDGVVMFSELPDPFIDEAIAAQVDYFQRIERPFEWKVYTFDRPSDLSQRLEQRGFEPGVRESFLVGRVAELPRVPPAGSFMIKRITSVAAIGDIVAVQESVWSRGLPWLGPMLAGALERTALFCAYEGDRPIGTGWIEFPAGCSFADLHGGAVLPEHRGRGIYSAIHAARVAEAKSRGVAYLAADATPMSSPLLLRKGFRHVCDTTPYRRAAR